MRLIDTAAAGDRKILWGFVWVGQQKRAETPNATNIFECIRKAREQQGSLSSEKQIALKIYPKVS